MTLTRPARSSACSSKLRGRLHGPGCLGPTRLRPLATSNCVYSAPSRWGQKGGWKHVLEHVSAAGQDSDIAQASTLIEGFDSDMMIADKVYDARDLIQT